MVHRYLQIGVNVFVIAIPILPQKSHGIGPAFRGDEEVSVLPNSEGGTEKVQGEMQLLTARSEEPDGSSTENQSDLT